MLAPTRDLVADLNRRARDHRLRHTHPGREIVLADGNQASVGDMIITRTNDRRLRLSPTDWVKNGDRWTITNISHHGGLTVRHNTSGLTTRLPADYVHESTGLGYATTIHSAQGVSADTMHGILTGQESRQQLYTMLTRGRHANHLYLQVVGDGDPHSVIRPEAVAPRTPTEALEQILARDDAPTSATTQLRELNDPATRLFEAVQRYTDSLTVATEHIVGPQAVADLDDIDQHIPGLTAEPAWPTLRAHLLALAAETGEHPLHHLHEPPADGTSPLAGDKAAVLEWRLPRNPTQGNGPLPWLLGPPERRTGSQMVRLPQSASPARHRPRRPRTKSKPRTLTALPIGPTLTAIPTRSILSDIAVWRAATGVDPDDLRPTGRNQLDRAAFDWQAHLDRTLVQSTAANTQPTEMPGGPSTTMVPPRPNRPRPHQPSRSNAPTW